MWLLNTTKRQEPDFKFPRRSYNKASRLERLGGTRDEAVAKSSNGATGAGNRSEAHRPAGCWEKSCRSYTFSPCVEQISEGGGKVEEKAAGAERKSAECWELHVLLGKPSDEGRWVGHRTAPPWTKSHLEA